MGEFDVIYVVFLTWSFFYFLHNISMWELPEELPQSVLI